MSLIQQQHVQLPSDQNASGRTLGDEEMLLLSEAIESGTLTSTKGQFVKRLEKRFAEMLGVKHCFACSSGTAAIHVAVAALDPEPGEEIITSPITDMGAITPILYQGAIPVFADVDPRTGNVTAETIQSQLSDRTKAIIVTHLFGNPCEMSEILELAQKHNVAVIEDCAQSFLAEHRGQVTGALGDLGCFSLQQGKHVTTGEGGLIVTNDDALARRSFLFINKAWGYGDEKPDHYFLALNYRMNELQGAVALAQMDKLDYSVRQRRQMADRLTKALHEVPGIQLPYVADHNSHSWWKYCLLVDERVIPEGSPALGAALKERGIASAPRYVKKPAFECEIIREQRTFGQSRFPFTLARPEALNYAATQFQGVYGLLDDILVLPLNEGYTDAHVDFLAASIRESVQQLSEGSSS